jgi:hypothetical protein
VPDHGFRLSQPTCPAGEKPPELAFPEDSQSSGRYVQNESGSSCPPITMNAAMSHVALNASRTVLVVITALVGSVIPVWAQQSEPSSASLDRIRAALQSPQPITITSDGLPLVDPSKPDEVRLGVLRFVRPETPGLFVEIRVPVGALASRAAHSNAATQHRRAENAARDEVAKTLAEFLRAQPK